MFETISWVRARLAAARQFQRRPALQRKWIWRDDEQNVDRHKFYWWDVELLNNFIDHLIICRRLHLHERRAGHRQNGDRPPGRRATTQHRPVRLSVAQCHASLRSHSGEFYRFLVFGQKSIVDFLQAYLEIYRQMSENKLLPASKRKPGLDAILNALDQYFKGLSFLQGFFEILDEIWHFRWCRQ